MKARLLFIVLLLVPIAFGQPGGMQISASGSCREFYLALNGSLGGCWDVKVDAPGQIYDGEWRNSFFYARNAFCDGAGGVRFRFAENSNISAAIKLRQDNTIYQTNFFIEQRCPEQQGDVFLPVLVVIMLMGTAVAWYEK